MPSSSPHPPLAAGEALRFARSRIVNGLSSSARDTHSFTLFENIGEDIQGWKLNGRRLGVCISQIKVPCMDPEKGLNHTDTL